jgi:hypothetical protein
MPEITEAQVRELLELSKVATRPPCGDIEYVCVSRTQLRALAQSWLEMAGEVERLRCQIQDTKETKLELLKYMRAFKLACDGGGDWCQGCEHGDNISCRACREKYYLENANPPLVKIINPTKPAREDGKNV